MPNNKKTDLRIQLTRKLIWNALLDLMENRQFESLTVKEICDQAMVHRTTFYKHFEDKYQLLSYGLDEIRELLDQQNSKDRFFHPIQTIESIGHLRLFKIIWKSEKENNFFSSILQNKADEALKKELHSIETLMGKTAVPIDIITAFISGGVSSLVVYWLENHEKINAKELDDYINLMINKEVLFSGKIQP
jgi:AcrR family transcriptional regulator